jgi:hypothetical protein
MMVRAQVVLMNMLRAAAHEVHQNILAERFDESMTVYSFQFSLAGSTISSKGCISYRRREISIPKAKPDHAAGALSGLALECATQLAHHYWRLIIQAPR